MAAVLVVGLLAGVGIVLLKPGADGTRTVAVPTTPATAPPTAAPTTGPQATGRPVVAVPVNATADCQAAAAVDSQGARNSYDPAKAFDGVNDTAWRCDGDASGRGITFDLGSSVLLTSVGLVPGYDKIDPGNGADRFVNSRRIQRARWVLDDGSSIEVTPAGERTMTTESITPTRTRTVRLVVEQTLPGTTVAASDGTAIGPTDYTSVSEVSFEAVQ